MLKPVSGKEAASAVSLAKEVTGRSVLEEVAKETQVPVSKLQEMIETAGDDASGQIRIRVKASTAESSVKIANSTARVFQQADVSRQGEDARNRQEFYARQIKVAGEKIETLQNQIQESRGGLTVSGLSDENRESAQKKLTDLGALLRSAEQEYRQFALDLETSKLDEAEKSGQVMILKTASAKEAGAGTPSLPLWKIPVIAFIVSLLFVCGCRFFLFR